MKQFIILMAMIALGLFLYACIAGDGDSILTALKAQWRHRAVSGPYYGVLIGELGNISANIRGLLSSDSCYGVLIGGPV